VKVSRFIAHRQSNVLEQMTDTRPAGLHGLLSPSRRHLPFFMRSDLVWRLGMAMRRPFL
jgi:hypothetical protein